MSKPLIDQDLDTPVSERARSRIRHVGFLGALVKLGIGGIMDQYRKAHAVAAHVDTAEISQAAFQRPLWRVEFNFRLIRYSAGSVGRSC